jgi:hypothetical protein
MKWTEPKLYDLSDLKNLVAQGACAVGTIYDGVPNCTPGNFADVSCVPGSLPGTTLCSEGSAATT